MEDKHELIEGSISLSYELDLISINIPLNPINSGGPLLNSNNEIMGMILFRKHAHDFYKLEKLKIKADSKKREKPSTKLLIESIDKNIVLIEAL